MFQITATPAEFTPGGGFSMQLLDPTSIVERTKANTLLGLRDALDAFVANLPSDRSFVVFTHWPRLAGKPPRGFKAASDRNEFMRRVNRNHPTKS